MDLPTIEEIPVPVPGIEEDKAYNVAFSADLGRHLVAARDLLKGDIIFREIPIASGLEGNSLLICPGCYNTPTMSVRTCHIQV